MTDSEDNKWAPLMSHLIESWCTQSSMCAPGWNPEFTQGISWNQAAAFAAASFHVLASRVPGSASSPQSPLPFLSVDPVFSYDRDSGFCSSDWSKDIILKLEGVLERHHLIVLPHSKHRTREVK